MTPVKAGHPKCPGLLRIVHNEIGLGTRKASRLPINSVTNCLITGKLGIAHPFDDSIMQRPIDSVSLDKGKKNRRQAAGSIVK